MATTLSKDQALIVHLFDIISSYNIDQLESYIDRAATATCVALQNTGAFHSGRDKGLLDICNFGEESCGGIIVNGKEWERVLKGSIRIPASDAATWYANLAATKLSEICEEAEQYLIGIQVQKKRERKEENGSVSDGNDNEA